MKRAVEWMSSNRVAANLLMVLIIFSGFVALRSINQEVFPEMDLDIVQISVVYPGASPEEIEESIIVKIEEALEGIEEIDEIKAVASENIASVTVEIGLGEDVTEVKDLIKSEIDRITTFPDLAERPEIRELTSRMQTIQVAVYGQASERTIKELARRIKDDLTAKDEISQVSIKGTREYELAIEVSESSLRRYGLTFSDLSNAVRRGSMDLAGGSIKSAAGEILIRTDALSITSHEYENIIIRSDPNGNMLRVGDVATVVDGFADSDLVSSFDGMPAAMITVFRSGNQNAPDVARVTKEYIEELAAELPAELKVNVWLDMSELLSDRIDLLTRNAVIGLILVLLALSIFLEIRLAIWVAMGIVISFLGTFVIMLIFDVTINMISLFAFILVLGIVVDDAIVVGENIFSEQSRGTKPQKASARGATRVMQPVFFAVTTSIVAFMPLMFVGGAMGKIMKTIPIIVISALTISLFESLFILPAHLTNLDVNRRLRWLGPLMDLQQKLARGLTHFVTGRYTRFLRMAIQYRYNTIAISLAILLLSLGLVTSGILKFTFMPEVEADNMFAQLTMPQGITVEQTLEAVRQIEMAALLVAEDYKRENPDAYPIYRHIYSVVGEQPSLNEGHGPGAAGRTTNPEIAEVSIELAPPDERFVSSSELARRWREQLGDFPQAESIIFTSNLMSMGNDVEVNLSASDFNVLEEAVDQIKTTLSTYQGVSDIRDDFELGKRELKLNLKPHAAALNLTLQDLAFQVRQGFYGEEVYRLQRGEDEVRVMVRYPESGRNTMDDIQNMRIRTVNGAEVPFSTVAQVEMGRGYSRIERVDGRRIITVMADVDDKTANANEINQALRRAVFPILQDQFPGITWSNKGIQEQQEESMTNLVIGFVVALFVMYALLAIPFKSYIQPLVIMSAVPFGIIGAFFGHLLLGYNLSMISMFGVVALSGVVINDSLILIDFVNERQRKGDNMYDAVIGACQARFRPIVLTSLTTFLGLTPMILEKSLQARFLIPMALSLGFGVLAGTVIILLMVPSGVIVIEDLRRFWSRITRRNPLPPVNSIPALKGDGNEQ